MDGCQKPAECYLLLFLGEFGKGKAWGWKEAVYRKIKHSVYVCVRVCVWKNKHVLSLRVEWRFFFFNHIVNICMKGGDKKI